MLKSPVKSFSFFSPFLPLDKGERPKVEGIIFLKEFV